MKVQELRIGNWVYIQQYIENKQIGSIYENGGFMTKDFQHSFSSIECANPIPLTEEWLLKFGFEKQGRWFAIMNYPIELYVSPDKMVYIGDELSIGYIEYVHQLQNLYFALTGEELTVNEK